MKQKKIFFLSFGIAVLFGLPFNWIFYKGETRGVSIFNIPHNEFDNLFYDFSLLVLNTLFVYIALKTLLKIRRRKVN